MLFTIIIYHNAFPQYLWGLRYFGEGEIPAYSCLRATPRKHQAIR